MSLHPAPRPAIFNDARAVDCRGDGHLTTTAYLNRSGTSADLLVLYLTRDGLNLIKKTRRQAAVPTGIIHVMSLIVRYSETTGSTPLAMWQLAQREINSQHAGFARGHGYPKPLVTFVNTNVLIEATDLVRARSGKEVLREMLDERLLKQAQYDVLITINIDPTRSEGGSFSDRSIYVGNYKLADGARRKGMECDRAHGVSTVDGLLVGMGNRLDADVWRNTARS